MTVCHRLRLPASQTGRRVRIVSQCLVVCLCRVWREACRACASPTARGRAEGAGGDRSVQSGGRVGSQPAVAKPAAPATQATGEFGTRRQGRAGLGEALCLLSCATRSRLIRWQQATWRRGRIMKSWLGILLPVSALLP